MSIATAATQQNVSTRVRYTFIDTTVGQSSSGDITGTIAHELTEMLTDPDPNTGWSDLKTKSFDVEVADICENDKPFGSKYPDGLQVDYYYDKENGECVAPGAINPVGRQSSHPNFISHGGPVMTNATVVMIFWGPSWNSGNVSFKNNMINAIQNKMLGTDAVFFSALEQYGVPNNIRWGKAVVNTAFKPKSGTTFTGTDLLNLLRDSFNKRSIPLDHDAIYIIMPDPKWKRGSGIFGLGFHSYFDYVGHPPDETAPPPIPAPPPLPIPSTTVIIPSLGPSPPGSEKVVDRGGNIVSNAKLYLIFWGSGWSSATNPSKQDVINATQTLCSSTYFSKLNQYRNIQPPIYSGSTTNTTTPLPAFIDQRSTETLIKDCITRGTVPDFQSDNNIIYYIIPTANTDFFTPPGSFSNIFVTSGTSGSTHAYYGMTVNTPSWAFNGTHFTIDDVMYSISGDLIRLLTNPDNIVKEGFTAKTHRFIAEPFFDYINWICVTGIPNRVNNVRVQPYWSNEDSECVISPTTVRQTCQAGNHYDALLQECVSNSIPLPATVGMEGASSNGCYLGAMVDTTGGQQATVPMIQAFNTLARKNAAVIHFSNHWFTGITFPVDQAKAVRSQGAIPHIRMMPWLVDNVNTLANAGTYTMANIIAGVHDAALTAWANAASDFATPLLVTFGVKVNGTGYPWSHDKEGSALCKAAYQHIITLFRNARNTNVKWAYHVDAEAEVQAMHDCYPGDDFIDWIGCSAYGATLSPIGCTSSLTKHYNDVVSITNVKTKPIAVFEWGMGDPVDYINTLANIIADSFPRIKLLEVWHEASPNNIDRRINKTPTSLAAYQAGVTPRNYLAAGVIQPTPVPTPTPTPTPTPGGIVTDKFGVQRFYQEKIGGEKYLMSSTLPDPRVGSTSQETKPTPLFSSVNSDGSFKIKTKSSDTFELRGAILTSSGYNEGGIASVNVPNLRSQGYMLRPNDWKNVEMTGYFKINSVSDGSTNGAAHFEFVLRAGRSTSDAYNIGSPPRKASCQATSYHINTYQIPAGRVKMEKDLQHTAGYTANNQDPQSTGHFSSMMGRWVGIKILIWNKPDGSVQIQHYMDDTDSNITTPGNKWRKLQEFNDHGQWGGGHPDCGGTDHDVVTWGGPLAVFRSDQIVDMDAKWWSISELRMGTTDPIPAVPIPTPPPPGGITTDKFGVQRFYKEKVGGEKYVMSSTIPDPRVNSGVSNPTPVFSSVNSDGSFKVNPISGESYELRAAITTSTGYNESAINSVNVPNLRSQGYMQAANDWKNIEITGYFKINSVTGDITTNGGEHLDFVVRCGQHSSSTSSLGSPSRPQSCQATAYHISTYQIPTGRIQFQKELQHTAGYATNNPESLDNFSSMIGRWVGLKATVWTRSDGSVQMEHYIDDTDSNTTTPGNKWRKLAEFNDHGQWGGGTPACGGTDHDVITWGGPLCFFRSDQIQDLDVKWWSVSELQMDTIDPVPELPAGPIPTPPPTPVPIPPGPPGWAGVPTPPGPVAPGEIQLCLSCGFTNGPSGSSQTDPTKSIGGQIAFQNRIRDSTLNNLWGDVTPDEAVTGSTKHRCIYILNTSTTSTFTNGKIWIQQFSVSNDDEIDIGIGTSPPTALEGIPSTDEQLLSSDTALPSGGLPACPTGQHYDSSFTACVDDNPPQFPSTCPSGMHYIANINRCVSDSPPVTSGVVFQRPLDKFTALSIEDIPPGQHKAIWIRRIVNPNARGFLRNFYVLHLEGSNR